MHYEAAYLLAVLDSNDSLISKDWEKTASALRQIKSGSRSSASSAAKTMEDLIVQRRSKLTSTPMGMQIEGPLPSEESNDDMGFGLFD
ncbi:60S acidic ribosomal protein P2-like [Monodelphis domestica]|uniref:60S acidic ribosomal protein P2-like n=1 Tax=Monodelphis domestica TaxID=13616 RepID=UPI0000F2C139|nr:60S acidic ribosomal protein P2-like [Monodelphis domestica]